MVNQINVGDRVVHLAFTDCFGKYHQATHNLVVESVTEVVSNHGLPTYYRINAVADRAQPVIQCEAAERFFASEVA